MADYIDNFVRLHKEHFKRNKKVITTNKWYEQDNLRGKKALFDQENELTNSILGRLTAFIKETESNGDRKLKKVQTFIDSTVSIINIHLKKSKDYLNYNLDVLEEEVETEEEIEQKSNEILFQDFIFNKKISIEDSLNKLNITNSIENVTITFYKNEKATLPMKEVLPLHSSEIKELTDNLKLSNEIVDFEFHIHKEQRGAKIPKWDEKKHYWQQEPRVLEYWNSEYLKIKKGFTVDGYFIHPWLYYHLNFYKTPIPISKDEEPIINPSFRDNEWYFAELLKKAEAEHNKGVCLFGSRRFSKSVLMSSVCDWKALVKANATTSITSGSSGDLEDLTSKIKTSMKYKVPAFILHIQKQDWEKGATELGLKVNAQNTIEHSRHTIKNLDSGAKTSTQKTAGGAPSVYLIEEIGKFAWEKPYLAAIPSFETPFGFKTTVIAVGTSGEASLSGDAMKAVANPKSFKFLEMDWDLLEDKMDKEDITWKRRGFASFIPGQMGYKTGFKRIERRFGDFLGIDSEYLNKITILQTDWKTNKQIILDAREEVKNDPLKYQQEIVQYPIDPEECFLSAEKNIFPYKEARLRREYLLETGLWDRRRELHKDSQGKIHAKISNKPLAEFPHTGGNIDAPYLIFEDIPNYTPPQYVYVAGGDFYKQEDSGTDSVGTIYIHKYDLFGDEFAHKLVASYAARPEKFTEFYENCLLLLEAYNAVIFPENEDLGGFQTFLEKRHLEEVYLMRNIDFSSTLEYVQGGRRKWGWTPANSKQKLLNLYANYTKEPVDTVNEKGEIITIKRVQTIDDIGLLSEMINYTKDGNYDRIISAMGSIGFLHFLEKNYIYPKGIRRAMRDGEPEEKKPPKKRERSFYTPPKKRAGFYKSRG